MNENLIASIKVKKLFGLYTYQLPESGPLSNAAILYGDNGVGKSTILRLTFHLLSAGADRGHRQALYKANFKELHVTLYSGITISATRNEKPLHHLDLTISTQKKQLAQWKYIPKSEIPSNFEGRNFFFPEPKNIHSREMKLFISYFKNEISDLNIGEDEYLRELKKLAPVVYLLNSDRRLDSDEVSDPSDEMELRKVMRFEDTKNLKDVVVRARDIALTQAMNSASRWLAKQAVYGTNLGSMNVHTVYVNVLKHLDKTTSRTPLNAPDIDISLLIKDLEDIETETNKHAKYELSNALDISTFKKSLSSKSIPKAKLAAGVISPYVESLKSRLNAVSPVYHLIDKFISTVNDFLHDKKISFELSRGLFIKNKLDQKLEASQLSSGEQQLLLLFCYILMARDKFSIFIIDEPEISLNVKWQRSLVQALIDISDSSKVQFIFASHSIELIAQHRSKVVKLVNKDA